MVSICLFRFGIRRRDEVYSYYTQLYQNISSNIRSSYTILNVSKYSDDGLFVSSLFAFYVHTSFSINFDNYTLHLLVNFR